MPRSSPRKPFSRARKGRSYSKSIPTRPRWYRPLRRSRRTATSLRWTGFRRAPRSLPAALINYRTAQKYRYGMRPFRGAATQDSPPVREDNPVNRASLRMAGRAMAEGRAAQPRDRARDREPGATNLESFSTIYSAAGRHIVADGRDSSGRHGGVLSVAGVRASGSGLPDDSGDYVLSGREPGRDGLGGDRAARAAIRAGARTAANDLDELERMLGDRAAVYAEPEHRRRRTGSAGVDQRRADLFASRPARTPDLQQDESRRLSDCHPGAYVEDPAAFSSGRPCRHPPRSENFPAPRRGPGQHQRRTKARR